MSKHQLQLILKRHAQQSRALRARQNLELALAVAANNSSIGAIAQRLGLRLGTVRRLRRIWRSYDPVQAQPWEVVL